MFYLRDLPDRSVYAGMEKEFPGMSAPALQLCLTLLRTGSDLLTGFETLLMKNGLSQGRFLVLMLLRRDPDAPMNPSELAEKMGIRRATMTGLLDGLERDGFVRRHTQEEDGRRCDIAITSAGLAVLKAMLPDYLSRIRGLMSGLSAREMKLLTDLLFRVNGGIPALTNAGEMAGRQSRSRSTNKRRKDHAANRVSKNR